MQFTACNHLPDSSDAAPRVYLLKVPPKHVAALLRQVTARVERLAAPADAAKAPLPPPEPVDDEALAAAEAPRPDQADSDAEAGAADDDHDDKD
jgi:hypothetical protein